ncbi:vomeronasal type-2 receptor 26-like [Leptodactylus fuscus]|uniref:vomeronasal type-2 receptor 26-like n=1 Tax=Leptodactylus fuscus TaxID=238119 RepID=UPI003F4EAE9B
MSLTALQQPIHPVPSFYKYVLAFMFAVDEINKNPDILPNMTLGYHVTDSCNNVNKALENVLQILSGPGNIIPNYSCFNKDILMGVIGDQSSKTSLQIIKLLSIYGLIQISYGATDPLLTDKKMYLSFFQTLPSDQTQYLAIAKLLRYFNWTWIGVCASDDDGGHTQTQELRKQAEVFDICIEFVIQLQTDDIGMEGIIHEKKRETFKNSESKILILCGTISFLTVRFIEEQSIAGHVKTLVIPSGSNIHIVSSVKLKASYHGSLVFLPPKIMIPNLRTFLEEVSLENRPNDSTLEHILLVYRSCKPSNPMLQIVAEEYYPHKLRDCNKTLKLQNIPPNHYYTKAFGTTYHVYQSVYAMAHALHEVLFHMNRKVSRKPMLKIPVSQCSDDCPPGYRRNLAKVKQKCCFQCIECSDGEISNETDKASCYRCNEDQWPNDKHQCVPKAIEFLSYSDSISLIITIITLLLFLKTSAILGIFILFRDTPVVKATNQSLSFILLVSIMLSFLCVFLFLGRPIRVTCMLRQTSFGIIFTVAISSILAKTILVYTAFKATKPGSPWRKCIGVKITNCLVFVCSLIQVMISIVWLSISPPFPESNTDLYAEKIILQCNEGSVVAFSIIMGYMGFLAAVSFMAAFLARNLPDSFNEAKNITFSMLVVCSVWVAFIPAYMSVTGKNTVLVEIFAIISSSVGILSCIFFPKCYIIILRPDFNSKGNLLKCKSIQ